VIQNIKPKRLTSEEVNLRMNMLAAQTLYNDGFREGVRRGVEFGQSIVNRWWAPMVIVSCTIAGFLVGLWFGYNLMVK
jgi:hypothetical protein